MRGSGRSRFARVAARLVEPVDGPGERRHTRLLGALWLTATVWLLMGMVTPLYEGAWAPGLLVLAAGAALIGAFLLRVDNRRLRDSTYVVLTVVGSAAISLAVLWGGDIGGLVYGVMYVYVTCFCFTTLREWAVPLVAVAMAMHLLALFGAGQPAPAGIWVTTWGPAIVTGALSGALVRWLDETMQRLKEVDDHRTTFIASVSHELRTPLTAILGFTEVLHHRWDRLDEDERRRYVGIIDRQAMRQLRLVDDVLSLTTGRSGSSVPVPTDVELATVLSCMTAVVSVPVQVDVPDGIVARVDPDHLEQIVTNLLVNAERYGEPPLALRASATVDGACIEVIDHGRGLPGGLDGGLTEAFVQGDSGDRRESAGVGLGLTICRRLVEANGGWLDYADRPGGGACLRVHLPSV